jgi:hypothetical protein
MICEKGLACRFAEKQITHPLDDNLFAQIERGLAGLCDVCNSGSIKGCLMFVQKNFDVICLGRQNMS